MPSEKQSHTIDTRHHLYKAQTSPEYRGSLPRTDFHELPESERRAHLRSAFSKGALAAAERAENERGQTDLDAALFKLSGSIHDFEESYKDLGEIRAAYKGIRTYQMDPETRAEFSEGKRNIRKFNEAVRNVIEVGGKRLGFDQLVNFLVTTYTATHGESPTAFELHAREVVAGMREEVNFKLALMAAGVEVNDVEDKDEEKGGDMEIEGVLIDTKASYSLVERARAKARAERRNPNVIVHSGITEEDYGGKLVLPFHKLQEVGKKNIPVIQRAVSSVHPGRKVA